MIFIVNFAVSLQSPFYLWPGLGCINTGARAAVSKTPKDSVAHCSHVGDIGERQKVPNAASLCGCKGCCLSWLDRLGCLYLVLSTRSAWQSEANAAIPPWGRRVSSVPGTGGCRCVVAALRPKLYASYTWRVGIWHL